MAGGLDVCCGWTFWFCTVFALFSCDEQFISIVKISWIWQEDRGNGQDLQVWCICWLLWHYGTVWSADLWGGVAWPRDNLTDKLKRTHKCGAECVSYNLCTVPASYADECLSGMFTNKLLLLLVSRMTSNVSISSRVNTRLPVKIHSSQPITGHLIEKFSLID